MEIPILWDLGISFHTDKLMNCASNLLEWIHYWGGKEFCVHPFYVLYFFNTIANKVLYYGLNRIFLTSVEHLGK